MKRGLQLLLFLVLVPLALLVGGCGGGGGGVRGGGGGGGSQVSGVAAAGAPLVGTVSLKDSSTPAKEVSTTLAADGSFSISVTSLTAPFIIKATGTAGGTNQTVYSFSGGAGVANVNAFSSMALALASGGLDPSTVYATPATATMQALATKIPSAVADIQTKLQPLLTAYDAAKTNPLTDTFEANHTGLDEVLDMVKVDIAGSTITVKNKATSAVIFTCQANAVNAGTFDPSKIPAPPVRTVVSPIAATVVVNKTATFTADVRRSTNKNVTWSVVETNGGTITSSGVYTAPSTEGIYHVKAVSVVDPTWPAIAVVKVISDIITVSITPTSATLLTGGSKAFTATVTGTGNSAVTWSVVESSGGSITSAGVYSAPTTDGTYHVKAVSAADTTKSATAIVTVTAPSPPKPGDFPIGTWMGPNGASFTITKLDHVHYYSGSITLPGGASTVNVSGKEPPGDSNVILLGGAGFGLNASIISSTSATFYQFICQDVSDLDAGDPDIRTLDGTMIMTTSSGNNINQRAIFTRQ